MPCLVMVPESNADVDSWWLQDRAEQLRVQQGQQPKSQGLPQGMFPGLQLPHFMFAQPGFQLQMQPQAQSPQQEGSQHVQLQPQHIPQQPGTQLSFVRPLKHILSWNLRSCFNVAAVQLVQ